MNSKDSSSLSGTKRSRKQQNGHLGGILAGKIGDNRYIADYAKDSRSKCRYSRCKMPIRMGEFRVGKIPPALKTGHATRTKWYHPECIFHSFGRMTKQTRTIENVQDIEDFDRLNSQDQEKLTKICLDRNNNMETDFRGGSESGSKASTDSITLLQRHHTDDTLAESDDIIKTNIQSNSSNVPHLYPQLSIQSFDSSEVANKIRNIGVTFDSVADRVVQCGLDGRYITTRTKTQLDEMLNDLGLDNDEQSGGRQKRRRFCFELGLDLS